MTNQETLVDALSQAVGWIEECGSDHEGRQYVLTEARAALRGISLVRPRCPAERETLAAVLYKNLRTNIHGMDGFRKAADAILAHLANPAEQSKEDRG
jgi:hypothetical protein